MQVSIFSVLVGLQAATLVHSIDPDVCVDPQGFVACTESFDARYTGCIAEPACTQSPEIYKNCLNGCGGTRLAGNLACWVQSCWNRIYSCDYQIAAIEYLVGTNQLQGTTPNFLPFYPPPEDHAQGPGGCSCNLGYAYGNLTYIDLSQKDFGTCVNAAVNGAGDSCTGCLDSAKISNVLNICPNYDLSYLGFPNIIANFGAQRSARTDCAVLEDPSDLCQSSFGISRIGPDFYNPMNLPSGIPGTSTLLNLGGNAFTEFVSAYTLTLYPGFTTTITPAPYRAVSGGETTADSITVSGTLTTSSGVSGGQTTVAFTTATGSAAASTTATKNAGMQAARGVEVVAVVVAIVVVNALV
ncbi:hypothetical protein BP6252_13063 [Coleophoma cylindrospora]|uniref:Uncharacterized protein n=1 Tax=Coleophoma cylindrospora TaxID=1849047 RepID=A0A3D8QA92_9HELO|nr:hypothetical protein BP6252_13063 [Coleophoma cylindrospora]